MAAGDVFLEARGVAKTFRLGKVEVPALRGVEPGAGRPHRGDLEDARKLEAVLGIVGGNVHRQIIGACVREPKRARKRRRPANAGLRAAVMTALAVRTSTTS